MQAAMAEDLIVGLGECRIAQYPIQGISTHALGSCIAVVAWDWKLRIGALIHVMLPDSSIDPARALAKPYVFADTAMPALFQALEAKGCVRKRLRWCLAGGANMMIDSSHFQIGKRNHLALKKIFWKLGVFIDQEDVGGTESRSVRLDLETGRIDMRRGAGREQVLIPAAVTQGERSRG